jgi:peptide/nickel transport system substrate-binding protein
VKRIVLSFAVAALVNVLAFGTGQADQASTDTSSVTEDGEPQYGGTFTYLIWGTADVASADVHVDIWPALEYVSPVLDRLTNGNMDKYGPKGSGEYTFGPQPTVPYKYIDGNLIERWSVDTDRATLHVRPGVYWSGMSVNPGVMERREYTAEDLAYNLKRVLDSPRGGGVVASDFIATPYDDSIYAKDRYTAIIEFKQFYFEWWTNILLSFEQMPREVIEAGPKDWNNLVGTGPFVIKEYVSGSHLAYKRNPDYWKTTIIDDKEYGIPFVDELVWPFIPDESTQIAALRTATLDAHLNVDVAHQEALDRTNPTLKKIEQPSGDANFIVLRTDQAPFTDRNVRRAMMIGTDRKAIFDAVTGIGVDYNWPIFPGSTGHVPFKELPASTQLLFEHNPELAREMLAAAGYPDGFDLTITVPTEELEMIDLAEMLAGLWEEDLGVRLKIDVVDHNAYGAIREQRTYGNIIMWEGYPLLSSSVIDYYETGAFSNYSMYSDAQYDQIADEVKVLSDPADQDPLLRDLFVKALDEVPIIPLAMASQYTYWWPWVKNYFGERNASIIQPPVETLWIDQALKKEMGF